ncbi:MAG: hypothetical protein AAF616_11960 [Bacteroidota bacterium]
MLEAISGLSQWWERALPFSFLCRLLLLVSAFGYLFPSHAQNTRCKLIPSHSEVLLDTTLIEPGSIQLQSKYHYDAKTKVIQVFSGQDSVEVCYRISTFFTSPIFSRDLATYDQGISMRRSVNPNAQILEKEALFDFGQVEKYGAITRGVSFGNRQNLFVNSSLNLQMQGKLDENLNISAVVTDQNVPYQPEGNTQQIRDFDNVFIKLYNDQFDLTAGDIVLEQPSSSGYFLRYYKNIQGLQASLRGGNDWKYKSRVSAAVSKGKFSSAFLQPVDGLSGPYRLTGPAGERFIVVLANSEKLFLDGKLLERGFDRDYVIDYNLAEITFNNHIVITQFSIIRVDFEYAEQFYARSNFSAFQSLEKGKVKLFASFYQEKDNPNANLGFTLDESSTMQLAGIGDNLEQAFVTGFDSVRSSENRILYEQVDTVDLEGNSRRVFRYSIDRAAELFSPTFSEVGSGMGNYRLRETTINGRIYEWISPVDGTPQGSFEPGAIVPLPNQRQMVTLGTSVALSPHETLDLEGAFSQRDENLFSTLDDTDNAGRAVFFSFQSRDRRSFLKGYKWQGDLSMEYDQRNFTFIDRYRLPLFDRDWNFDPIAAQAENDLILFGSVGLLRDPANKIIVTTNRRKRGDAINGWQNQIDLNQEWKDLKLVSTHFWLRNEQSQSQAQWFRSRSDISYTRWAIMPGVAFEVDENEVAIQDSVASTLMNFRASEFYLASGDSSKSAFRFGYKVRQDRLPVAGEIEKYLLSRNFNGTFTRNGPHSRLTIDANYRKVEDQLDLNVGQDEVINGRIHWTQTFLKRSLSHNFSYSVGNAQELRREFVYLPVNTGEGTHTWRDTNGDGIQDLNEFFEAINPDERNFVKFFTPTDEYITSFQTFYLHTIDLKAPFNWRTQGGIKSFAQKFSANINLNVNYKTASSAYLDRLSPFQIDLESDQFISAQDSRRYTLFFNRNGRGLAADLTRQTGDSKQLLTQGFELGARDSWITNVKVSLSSAYTFRITSTLGSQRNRSDFLESRNFNIQTTSYKPQLIWQPDQYLRIVGSYERKGRVNDFSEVTNEQSIYQSYTGELTWNQANKGAIRATLSLISIDFDGDPASYLGYLLLDGLRPGSNQTWQVNVQRKLSKGMQLSLVYNGRNSADAKAIHTGSMQVTAFF